MRQSRAGYSLFEVLIAFAILAMVLSVLIPGQARYLTRTKLNQERVLAMDYAQSVLERGGLSDPLDSPEDRFTYRDWQVTRRVPPLPGTPPQLHVTVEVLDASGKSLATLDALRPEP
ncbi:type IV pilus modification PilV family protein [Aliiroseovarius sp.]|uniref:type IV pilus modification PilV family protein n=1 Tax=Aliiroseovarius sp. TaxID=1872442 RepID=UPI003BAAA5A0